jgi:hypothetical protein
MINNGVDLDTDRPNDEKPSLKKEHLPGDAQMSLPFSR